MAGAMEFNERSNLASLERVIVLGCSKSRRAALAPLIEALSARGNPVEVVSGLEASAVPWTDAIRRVADAGIYLLCGSDDLPETYLAQLRQAAEARGIRSPRLWSASIDWSRPQELIVIVDSMLRGERPIPPSKPLQPTATANVPPVPQPRPTHKTVVALLPTAEVPNAATQVARPPEVQAPPMQPPVSNMPSRPAMTHPAPGVTASGQVSVAPPIAQPSQAYDEIDELDARRIAASRTRRFVMVSAAVAAVVLGALAIVSASSNDDAESVAAAEVEPSQSTPAAEADEPAEPVAAAAPSSPKPAAVPVEPAAAEPADDEAEVEAIADSPSEVPADPAAEGGDIEVVFAALKQREIRALDTLVVAPLRRKQVRRRSLIAKTAYEDAEAYCQQLDIGGVRHWRLPSIGELATLHEGDMLSRFVYWSSTDGDAYGTDRIVWNGKKDRMGPVPPNWRGGQTLCVRSQVISADQP